MFNRRAFFRKFGATIAAVAIAQKVVTSIALEKLLNTPQKIHTVLNPAYAKARYEVAFLVSNSKMIQVGSPPNKDSIKQVVYKRNSEDSFEKVVEQNQKIVEGQNMKLIVDRWPPRFDEQGKYIEPFIPIYV